jgi:hypothetical protein
LVPVPLLGAFSCGTSEVSTANDTGRAPKGSNDLVQLLDFNMTPGALLQYRVLGASWCLEGTVGHVTKITVETFWRCGLVEKLASRLITGALDLIRLDLPVMQ